MIRRVIGLLLFGLVGWLLSSADYGFYHPRMGVVAAGTASFAAGIAERSVLELTISEQDQKRIGAPLTLERLSAFYGAQDTANCSVRRTFNSDNKAYLTRQLGPGERVFLCLD